MVQKREASAPWSLTRKAGVESATVNGDIEVPQFIQPVLNTGFVDDKGNWKGRPSSDEQFIAFGTDDAIANTASILKPELVTVGRWPIDMTGYNSIFVAINVTNAGNYAIEAVQGPANFANLGTVDARSLLQGNLYSKQELQKLFGDSSHALVANVWNLMYLQDTLQNQKILQFKITNNSGAESDIQTAFMRCV